MLHKIKMIYIVQVIPYTTNNGCSVRIGKGIDHTMPLEPKKCGVYEFVETNKEVKEIIKTIKSLPNYYRQRMESIEKLKIYMKMYNNRLKWDEIKNNIYETRGYDLISY